MTNGNGKLESPPESGAGFRDPVDMVVSGVERACAEIATDEEGRTGAW